MDFARTIAIAVGLLALPVASASTGTAQEKTTGSETLGTVHFTVSCTAEAQAEFDRAVALLHSFWWVRPPRRSRARFARTRRAAWPSGALPWPHWAIHSDGLRPPRPSPRARLRSPRAKR